LTAKTCAGKNIKAETINADRTFIDYPYFVIWTSLV